MNLITGIISLVILLGSLSRILIKRGRPQTFGFSTTVAFFLGLLGGIMSLAKDWSWWWTVPTGLVGLYGIFANYRTKYVISSLCYILKKIPSPFNSFICNVNF